jgi:uncharacterized protein (DUF983 family)
MGESDDPNLLFAPLGNRTQIMIAPPPLGFVGRIVRAMRLRCPRCGRGRLFAGWFTMHDKCSECGLDLRREPGFYLGSIYINYGLTAFAVTAVYVTAVATGHGRDRPLLWGTLAFCVLFPLWFFRYARSLWLSMDQFWDADANDS